MPSDPEFDPFVTRGISSAQSGDPNSEFQIGDNALEETTGLPSNDSAAGAPNFPGFELLEELGRGGMGVVYRANQISLNRMVALKTVIGKGSPEANELNRFLLEAESLASATHPNVVQVFEYGERDGKPFMVLELLKGGTLQSKMDKLKPYEIAKLFVKIANGVDAAHEAGLVHRDLKPSNILFDSEGEPNVADFGLVKMKMNNLTQTGTLLGTPAYMSPEQCRNAKFVGPTTDVWAMGVMLYECLTGVRPFKGADVWEIIHKISNSDPIAPKSIRNSIPKDLELICLKCLEKNPSDRYLGADELAAELNDYAQGKSISIRSPGIVERSYKWAKRHPNTAVTSGLSVTALILLVFTSIVSWFWLEAEDAYKSEKKANQIAELERQKAEDAYKNEKKANQNARIQRQRADAAERKNRNERALVAKTNALSQLHILKKKGLWDSAITILEETSNLLGQETNQAILDELNSAKKDIRLLARLDNIRMRKARKAVEKPEKFWIDLDIRQEYGNALEDFGIDFAKQPTDEIVEMITSSRIKYELIQAIDDWVWGNEDATADKVWSVTAQVTKQEWRRDMRMASISAPAAMWACQNVDSKQFTPSLAIGIGLSLRLSFAPENKEPIRWMEKCAALHPSDFWINFYLGIEYLRLKEYKLGAGAFRTATALRPDAHLAKQFLIECLEKSN